MQRTISRGFVVRMLLVIFVVVVSGCTVVQPYHRDTLSQSVMQLDYEKSESAAREHFLNSLEGASGGFGVGGGGCGCN